MSITLFLSGDWLFVFFSSLGFSFTVVIKIVGLLGSLTTHGDRGIRRSQVSLVLRVSAYYYQYPPMIHGIAVKQKNKMGDGRRDPKGHQANSAR
jgi:hypothetical protein